MKLSWTDKTKAEIAAAKGTTDSTDNNGGTQNGGTHNGGSTGGNTGGGGTNGDGDDEG